MWCWEGFTQKYGGKTGKPLGLERNSRRGCGSGEDIGGTGSSSHKGNFFSVVASIHLYVGCSGFHPACLASWPVFSVFLGLWLFFYSFHILPYFLDFSLFLAPCLGPHFSIYLFPCQCLSLWGYLFLYFAQTRPALYPFYPSRSSTAPRRGWGGGAGMSGWVVGVGERPPGPEEAPGGGLKPLLSIFAYV